MKCHSTPARRALLVCAALFALLSSPAMAQNCPQAKIDGAKTVNITDFTTTPGGRVRTTLVFDGRNYLQLNAAWVLAPGVLISLTVMSVNFIGDGIRDALDPKLRSR